MIKAVTVGEWRSIGSEGGSQVQLLFQLEPYVHSNFRASLELGIHCRLQWEFAITAQVLELAAAVLTEPRASVLERRGAALGL